MATDRPDGDTALLDLDNDYDSEEDEDFQLDEDDAGEDDDALSSSEGEDDEAAAQEQRPSKKRKLGGSSSKKDDDGEIMELDSGDEATIQKARQRKKMKGAKGGDDDEDDIDFDDDDEGGEGGFVKTRAMRMRMCVCFPSCIPAHEVCSNTSFSAGKKSASRWRRSKEPRSMSTPYGRR